MPKITKAEFDRRIEEDANKYRLYAAAEFIEWYERKQALKADPTAPIPTDAESIKRRVREILARNP